MIRNILIVTFIIIGFVAFIWLCLLYGKFNKTNKNKQNPKPGKAVSALLLLIGSFIGLVFLPGSFHQVNTGTIAVVRHLGKISKTRDPGTHYDFYFTNVYDIYDTKVQQDKIVTSAYSKDGQTMVLEVFLQYQVQQDKIIDIAKEYGKLDVLQSRIETVTIEKTKAVMSSAEAMNIIQNRSHFSDKVSEEVRSGISSDYYVDVKDVVLTNIDFTEEFEKSVENKVIALQDKEASITKAEAQLEVAKKDAEKKITEANGNASAQLILAEAAAKAATAKLIELSRALGYTITETTNDEITTYVVDTTSGPGVDKFKVIVEDYIKYFSYLETWNGELPKVVSDDDGLSIIVPQD